MVPADTASHHRDSGTSFRVVLLLHPGEDMRLDKCEFCDYNEVEGSGYAGLNPGCNGRVRLRDDGNILCDVCNQISHEALIEKEFEDLEAELSDSD